MVRERAGGSDMATLTAPVHIGIGTKMTRAALAEKRTPVITWSLVVERPRPGGPRAASRCARPGAWTASARCRSSRSA